MLADFYFCICVGHDRRTQDAVLSILRTLRAGGADGPNPGIAVTELERCDIWTKVYAIPEILACLESGRLAPRDRELAARLLVTITGGEGLSEPWRKLIEDVLSHAGEESIAADFTACASLLLKADALARSEIPYMDLPAQTLPVLLLSVMHHVLSGRAKDMLAELLQEGSPARSVAEAALAYRYGRLPLRLAAACAGSDSFGVSLEQLERSCAFAGCATLEPDLARILHAPAVDAAAGNDNALRALLVLAPPPHQPIGDTEQIARVLGRLGIAPAENPSATLTAGKDVAHCIKHVIQVMRAIELRHEVVFGMFESDLAKGNRPFWIEIRMGVAAPERYGLAPEFAAWFMSGVCGALADWLDRRPGEGLPAAAWIYAAQAADILTPQSSDHRRPACAITEILFRTAARRIEPAEVIERLRGLPQNSQYLQLLLPRIAVQLVRWLARSIWQAVPGRPEAKWLKSARDVCDFAREQFEGARARRQRVVTGDEMTDAACADNLIVGSAIEPWDRLLPRTPAEEWPHSPKELLLPLRQTEDDWYPTAPLPSGRGVAPSYGLYVAAGRCVHHVASSKRDPWPDWDRLFTRTAVGGFDSLLRLQLMSFLRLDGFDIERRCTIAETLLAGDAPYEVDKALQKIFSEGIPAQLGDHAHQVLVSRIESEAQRARHRDYPLAVELEQDRRDTFQVCIDWVARLMTRPDRAAWILRFGERRSTARLQQSPLQRVIECNVEHLEGEPVLLSGLSQATRRTLQVRGAAFDVERQSAAIVGAILDVPANVGYGVLDDRAKPERADSCIGLVTAVSATPEHWVTSIELGRLGRCEVTANVDPGFTPGSYVVVPLRWNKGVHPVPAGAARAVPLLVRPGDVEEVSVKRDKGEDANDPFSVHFIAEDIVRLDSAARGPLDSPAWSRQPDTTVMKASRRWARFENGKWRPLVEDRLALLGAMAGLPDRRATLAWTGTRRTTAAGAIAHVLDAGDGLSYAIELRDFSPASRARLESLLAGKESDAAGTPGQLIPDALVTLGLADDEDSGLLELVGVSDERIQWNGHFAEGDVVTVHHALPAKYFVRRPPESAQDLRPQEIPVVWTRVRPAGIENQAIVVAWDPRKCVLSVDKVVVHTAHDVGRWPPLCEAWLDLKEGDPLSVRLLPTWVAGDRTLGVTEDGFAVDVPSEEWCGWSMAGTARQPMRECRVTRIEPRFPLNGYGPLRVKAAAPGVELDNPRWHGATGVIYRTPKGQAPAIWGVVVWPKNRPAELVDCDVELPASSRTPLRIGDEVELLHIDSKCHVSVWRAHVFVSPIWKVTHVPALPDAEAPSFIVWHGGRYRHAAQQGTDGLLVAGDAPEPPQLEGEFVFVGQRFELTINRNRRWLRRVRARTSAGDARTGHFGDGTVYRGRYRWRIFDELLPVPGSANGVVLMRMFRGVTPLGAADAVNSRAALEEQAQQEQQKMLDRLIDDAEPVAVELDSGSELRLLGVTLPVAQQRGRRGCVPLAESERFCYVPEADKRAGIAILRQGNAGLEASTLRVPPLASVQAWIDWLGHCGVVAGEPTPDKEERLIGTTSLFYVGPELADPVTSVSYPDGPRYRFEWAPGRCLVLPASALRFNSKEFATTAGQLFFGDGVRRVAFKKEEGQWVIDIREVGIALSEAHRLYRQALRWKVVHLLEVSRSDEGDFSIARVEVIEENSFQSQSKRRAPPAVLGETAAVRLDPLLERGRTGWVHGRLDQDLYLKTEGRELSFDPVWLTLGGDGLASHERVFLTAGRIGFGANDCFLEFSAPEGMIGPRAPMRPMGRRGFSARTDLLPRLGLEAASAIEGSRYLVRLSARGDEAVRPVLIDPRPEYRADVPARRESDLRAWLRSDTEPPLVTILDDDPEGSTVFEVRPGVFVAVEARNIDTPATRPLQFGSVLRLRLKGDAIDAVPAMPSDHDLIPPAGRAITLLPMRPRGAESAADLVCTTRYTAEGLPNAVAFFVSDRRLMIETMVELMHYPHPRPAWMAPSEEGDVLVTPEIDPANAAVVMKPLVTHAVLTAWSGEHREVPWPLLTFKDRPATQVIETAVNRRWRPHDGKTWSITKEGGTPYALVPAGTAATALLVAEVRADQWALRYSSAALPRFVFPARELASMLPTRPHEAWEVTIAKIDHAKRWMLVEVAPGRIYVLPAVLLVAQAEGGINEADLSFLALECFGPGDDIGICRALGNSPEEVDRIRLVSWTPGARSALGGANMALRFAKADVAQGACEFGAGDYRLTLPSAAAPGTPGLTVIDANNNMAPWPIGAAGAGTLLRAREDGGLEIDGLPGYKCSPDRETDWSLDPVGARYFKLGVGQPPQAGPALLAAGGLLPVTIKLIDDRRVVHFNRRNQHRGQIEGVCPFRVLGIMDDGRLLLRFGSHLRQAFAHEVIHGLPKTFEDDERLAGALTDVTDLLWARLAANGGIDPGLSSPRAAGDEGTFLPLCMVYEDDGVSGLVCQCTRSRALHWLAIEQLAWADLRGHPALVRSLVIDPREPLRAKVLASGGLAVTAHPQAASDFALARPGSLLMVRDTGVNLPDGRRLVRSAASDVLLTLSGQLKPGAIEQKVVVRMRDRKLLVLHATPFIPNQLWLDVAAPEERVPVMEQIVEILKCNADMPTRPRAVAQFHDLVHRAWRHWAREVAVSTPPAGSFGMWLHARTLRPVLLGDGKPKPHTEATLRTFCRNVELTEQGRDESLLHLAAASRAIAGDLSLLAASAMRAATAAHRITLLGRLCPPGIWMDGLPETVVNGLSELHLELQHEESQLDFGPPLPPLR